MELKKLNPVINAFMKEVQFDVNESPYFEVSSDYEPKGYGCYLRVKTPCILHDHDLVILCAFSYRHCLCLQLVDHGAEFIFY